jgi:hypothetical protein
VVSLFERRTQITNCVNTKCSEKYFDLGRMKYINLGYYSMRKFVTRTRQIVLLIATSRRVRWAEYVVRVGETRAAYRILVGKTLEKFPLGRSRPK